jgi:P4 family phage/plasmid primase-like protien
MLPSGRKQPRHFIKLSETEKVYEYDTDSTTGGNSKTKNIEWPDDLSPKAERIQAIVHGIAKVIGGDHTHDLARLLRFPCTLNRKDERNGKQPVPCELVECDATRRYPLADFEKFAEQAPEKVRAKELAKVKLPSGKRLTPSRLDSLNKHVNRCAVAEPGSRSGVDFALCCHAIEHGLDKEAVWAEVQSVGKFGERGRDYFDLTWRKAEAHTREKFYLLALMATGGNPSRVRGAGPTPPESPGPAPGQQQATGAEPLDAGEDLDGGTIPGEGFDPSAELLDDPHRLAREWLSKNAAHPEGGRLRFYREEFWRWRDTHWSSVPDSEMRAGVARFCKTQLDHDHAALVAEWTGDDSPPRVPKVTRELVSNVLQALAGEALLPREVPQPVWLADQCLADEGAQRRNYIALANGILDVDALLAGAENVLLPHTPRWFSPVCLPYPFDPTAACPKWKAFLARNLADSTDKATMLQQFAGYLLLPDTSMQRFLMMVGEGGNGKSVICAMLVAILGKENTSSVALQLFGEKFRLVETLGKLANITAEVGELDKVAEGQLKAFVTGDPIQFEKKFKQSFTACPTARLVLATNNPPQFSDKSDGIWRRMLLLHCAVKIPEHECIAGMDKVEFWQKSGELPGILNWALAGLHTLRRQGRFVVPLVCQDGVEKLRTDANPARRFLKERYKAADSKATPAGDVYGAYRDWCQAHGHHPLAENIFGKEVFRAFKGIERKRGERQPARQVRDRTRELEQQRTSE